MKSMIATLYVLILAVLLGCTVADFAHRAIGQLVDAVQLSERSATK